MGKTFGQARPRANLVYKSLIVKFEAGKELARGLVPLTKLRAFCYSEGMRRLALAKDGG